MRVLRLALADCAGRKRELGWRLHVGLLATGAAAGGGGGAEAREGEGEVEVGSVGSRVGGLRRTRVGLARPSREESGRGRAAALGEGRAAGVGRDSRSDGLPGRRRRARSPGEADGAAVVAADDTAAGGGAERRRRDSGLRQPGECPAA